MLKRQVLAGHEAAPRLDAAGERAHGVQVEVVPGGWRIDVPAGDTLVHPEHHVFQVGVHVGGIGEVGPGAAPGQGHAAVILPAEPADARIIAAGGTRLLRRQIVRVVPAKVLRNRHHHDPEVAGAAVSHQPLEVGHGAVHRIHVEPVLRHQPEPLEVVVEAGHVLETQPGDAHVDELVEVPAGSLRSRRSRRRSSPSTPATVTVRIVGWVVHHPCGLAMHFLQCPADASGSTLQPLRLALKSLQQCWGCLRARQDTDASHNGYGAVPRSMVALTAAAAIRYVVRK